MSDDFGEYIKTEGAPDGRRRSTQQAPFHYLTMFSPDPLQKNDNWFTSRSICM